MFIINAYNIYRTGRSTNLVHRRRKKIRIIASTVQSSKVARSRDTSDSCWPISREQNDLETTKFVGRLLIPRAIIRNSFKVTRPINAYTVNAQYLPNGKAYEVQTWYTDEDLHHRQAP